MRGTATSISRFRRETEFIWLLYVARIKMASISARIVSKASLVGVEPSKRRKDDCNKGVVSLQLSQQHVSHKTYNKIILI